MRPNVAPDSGNKPGVNTVLVAAHKTYQSILIYSGVLRLVTIIWPLVLWENFHNKAGSGQYWAFLNSGSGYAYQSTDPSPSESTKVDQLSGAESCHFSLWSRGTAGYSNVFCSTTFKSIKIDAVPNFRSLSQKSWWSIFGQSKYQGPCSFCDGKAAGDRHVAVFPLLNSNLFISAVSYYTVLSFSGRWVHKQSQAGLDQQHLSRVWPCLLTGTIWISLAFPFPCTTWSLLSYLWKEIYLAVKMST